MTSRGHRRLLPSIGFALLLTLFSACSTLAGSEPAEDLADESRDTEAPAALAAPAPGPARACASYMAGERNQGELEQLGEALAGTNTDGATDALAALVQDAASLDGSDASAVVALFSSVPRVRDDYRVAHDDSCVAVLDELLTRGEQLGFSSTA